jgi:hypothetical protein
MGDTVGSSGSWGLVLAASDVDAVEQFRETSAVQVGRITKFVGPGDDPTGGDHITDAFRCIAAGERGGVSDTPAVDTTVQAGILQSNLFTTTEPDWTRPPRAWTP